MPGSVRGTLCGLATWSSNARGDRSHRANCRRRSESDRRDDPPLGAVRPISGPRRSTRRTRPRLLDDEAERRRRVDGPAMRQSHRRDCRRSLDARLQHQCGEARTSRRNDRRRSRPCRRIGVVRRRPARHHDDFGSLTLVSGFLAVGCWHLAAGIWQLAAATPDPATSTLILQPLDRAARRRAVCRRAPSR